VKEDDARNCEVSLKLSKITGIMEGLAGARVLDEAVKMSRMGRRVRQVLRSSRVLSKAKVLQVRETSLYQNCEKTVVCDMPSQSYCMQIRI
jgi:hypothetical protein